MKLMISLFLSLLIMTPAFATTENLVENVEVVVEDNEQISIQEIKNFISNQNSESTCMDEYFKRRKQLILKLGLSPVTIVAGTVASAYLGGVSGLGIAFIAGAQGDWSRLGYVVGGGMLGGFAGAGVLVADTTSGVIRLLENNLILKALAEYYMDVPGDKVSELYQKVMKKSDSSMSEEEFLGWLIEQNESGKLCDGSFVKKPKIRLGSKLKYKVARIKDIRKNL